MSAGRFLASATASLAVAGLAALAVTMHGRGEQRSAADPATLARTSTAVSTAALTAPSTASSSVPDPSTAASSAATTTHSGAPTTTPPPAGTSSAPSTATQTTSTPAPPPARSTTSPTPTPHPTTTHVVMGGALPLHFSTGTATEVITVTAHSYGSTVATLQAWTKAPGGGWLKWGSAVTAHVGSDGLSTSPSETKSATPVGSFTLTQAFGYDSDPGTALPYRHTTPADWWISQSGPLYNTLQHCSSGCSFTLGSPNEHLYYERPYYAYAVVIDYNTRNSPTGVQQGKGSAFFLHVTDGAPTAGCVAISSSKLVSIMRWLTPTRHPRILIGVV